MRTRDNIPQNPSPTQRSGLSQPNLASSPRLPKAIADGPLLLVLTRIADALDRLVKGIEKQNKRLGGDDGTRYTRPPGDLDLVDENTMAAALNISKRTLGRHRRDGRLPGCWVRNAGRILWRVAETRKAWERGIA